MTQLKHTLEAQQGIHAVEVNHAAGSLTVKYDSQVHQGTDIWDVLEDLDILVATVLDTPQLETPAEGSGHSTAAKTLTDALDDLDKRFAAFTGHTVNLRTLFPLSLAGIGAWRIWEQGLMLEAVPGWLMVWLAFDAFIKLHPPMPTRVVESGGSPGSIRG